jgi:hypothetical protein
MLIHIKTEIRREKVRLIIKNRLKSTYIVKIREIRGFIYKKLSIIIEIVNK